MFFTLFDYSQTDSSEEEHKSYILNNNSSDQDSIQTIQGFFLIMF